MPEGDATELLQECRRFSRVTGTEAALLVEVRPTFERHADAVVDAFYDHLIRFDALLPLLANPGTVARLSPVLHLGHHNSRTVRPL